MTHELTHASFFSGVGGLDMGLERAGWRTVSFSEIDPYASAVLAERWPGVPNLGSIVDVAARSGGGSPGGTVAAGEQPPGVLGGVEPWHGAVLYSGGFPCQDLSVAGKRRGLAGDRSGLAFAFLDLVERHRPPAVLIENVPGLLSSHAGRDLGALLGSLGELGYGWAYRVLDARHFGVPQRRRRVFILGIHARVDPSGQRAAEVLSVGSRCGRHPATGHEAGEGASPRADDSTDVVGTIDANHGRKWGSDQWVDPGKGFLRVTRPPAGGQAWRRQGAAPVGGSEPHAGDGERANPVHGTLGPSSDADRNGAPDGLAGRPHDRSGVAQAVYAKRHRAASVDDSESWDEADTAPTLNGFDVGDARSTTAVLGTAAGDDVMLPLGLDSHRYRCCGNGVVSSVAEYIGRRLVSAMQETSHD